MPIAKHASKNGYEIYVATRVAKHGHIIQDLGFNLVPLQIDRARTNLFLEIKTLIDLVGLFRSIGPDLIHNMVHS